MSKETPSSILIVGSGVFGLSTAWSLTKRPEYKNTKITLLERLDFPAPDAASIDSSRIVRPDYPDAAYSKLASEAQKVWRGDFGADGRYTEAGLCILMDDTADAEQGRKYMQGSLQNVKDKLGLKEGKREDGGQVTVLNDEKDVKSVVKNMDGDLGKYGYVNWTSGWAQAEDAMVHLRKLVQDTGRVEFRVGELKQLIFENGNSVKGAELVDGSTITADLTILATGAWTPKFLDLRGIASANGQILAYIDLTQEEQNALGSNPSVLNESTGFFIIQPSNRVLKVARHGYGYANPTTIPHPERPDSGEKITVSLPRTKVDDPGLGIAPEGLEACRQFLTRCVPNLASRPWTQTRICWYADTPTGDFLVTYHPAYSNLFLATGGSGHAYKFLPVIGDRIVEVLLGEDRDELGAELRQKWAWPKEKFRDEHVFTDDWRGGRRGMILDEEMGPKGEIRVGDENVGPEGKGSLY
jgi:sarcosine oxidase/L-pipecolate oxidase